jgi:hypothetical protein
MKRALLLIVLGAGACTGIDDLSDLSQQSGKTGGAGGGSGFLPPDQGVETQGTQLFGETIDPLPAPVGYYFSASTAGKRAGTNTPVTVALGGNGSALFVAGSATIADGVVLPADGGGSVLLSYAGSEAGTTFYHVTYFDAANTALPLCGGGEALPVRGAYDVTRRHQDVAGRISFSCDDGVVYKCVGWGYAPGVDPAAQAWTVHQACTREANADYCGDGIPHTHTGTAIMIFDELGINLEPPPVFFGLSSWPPPVNQFTFEAGWTENGAVCLSKLRWSALPVGGFCPTTLPDPRVDVTAKSCDDYHSEEGVMTGTNTVMFDASLYNDLALQVWRNGFDRVSTIDGYFDDTGRTKLEPYQAVGTFTHVRTDAELLRVLPASVDPLTVDDVALYATSGGTDVLYLPTTKASLLPAGYVQIGWRGYAFNQVVDWKPPLAPLVLYRNPTTGDYATTATGKPAAAYQEVATVGYLAPLDGP